MKDLRCNTIKALLAVTEMGAAFYDDNAINWPAIGAGNYEGLIAHVSGWPPEISKAVCATREEAIERRAYFIRAKKIGRKEEWQLCRFAEGEGGSLDYVGDTFATPTAFYAAMNTVYAMILDAKIDHGSEW